MFNIGHLIAQHANSRAFDSAVGQLDAELGEMGRLLLAEKAKSRAAEEKAQKLALSLALQAAHSEALLAQIKALAAAHPDSPLLKHTGVIKADGAPQKVMNRDFYNPTFDALAKKSGVNNPEKYRY